MNRRTDVGARWSSANARGVPMGTLARKYRHDRWSVKPATNDNQTVRLSLVA